MEFQNNFENCNNGETQSLKIVIWKVNNLLSINLHIFCMYKLKNVKSLRISFLLNVMFWASNLCFSFFMLWTQFLTPYSSYLISWLFLLFWFPICISGPNISLVLQASMSNLDVPQILQNLCLKISLGNMPQDPISKQNKTENGSMPPNIFSILHLLRFPQTKILGAFCYAFY